MSMCRKNDLHVFGYVRAVMNYQYSTFLNYSSSGFPRLGTWAPDALKAPATAVGAVDLDQFQ